MKKSLLLLLVALGLHLTAFAQLPDRGSVLVGGTIGTISVSTDNSVQRSLSVSGTPQLGIMVTRNLALGVGVPMYFSSSKTTGLAPVSFEFQYSQVGVAPFARYYVGPGRLRPYLTASAGQTWLNSTVTSSIPGNSDDFKTDLFYYSGGLGLAYFINRNVSFDLTAVYNGSNEPRFISSGVGIVGFNIPEPKSISVQFGFQIFL